MSRRQLRVVPRGVENPLVPQRKVYERNGDRWQESLEGYTKRLEGFYDALELIREQPTTDLAQLSNDVLDVLSDLQEQSIIRERAAEEPEAEKADVEATPAVRCLRLVT